MDNDERDRAVIGQRALTIVADGEVDAAVRFSARFFAKNAAIPEDAAFARGFRTALRACVRGKE